MTPSEEWNDENPNPFFEERKFVPEILAREILNITKIITMKDNNEIYFYNRGLWDSHGEAFIRSMVTDLLGSMMKKSYADEVVYYIQTITYHDRTVFDMPANLIPLINGIYNISTRRFRPYTINDFFTTRLNVTYDEKAKCPLIEKFLGEVCNDVFLLKEVIAYCMYRNYPIQKSVMLIGEGNNGKSVFLGLVKAFLGKENVSSISLQDLEIRNFARGALYQKMANIYPDIPDKSLSTTGTFKMLLGGDNITADKKFKDYFNFVNYAKLLFSCNKMPMASDDSDAYHRRWVYITFPNFFDGEKCDPYLIQKITTQEELSGLFNELVTILPSLLERGRFSYALTTDELREYNIRASNPAAAFLLDCIENTPDGYVPKKELYSAYTAYCRSKNLPIVQDASFVRNILKVREMKEERKTIGGERVRCWVGIRLKDNSIESREVSNESGQDVQDVHHISSIKPSTQNSQKIRGEYILSGRFNRRKTPDILDMVDTTTPTIDWSNIDRGAYERLILSFCQDIRSDDDVYALFESQEVCQKIVEKMIEKGALFRPKKGFLKVV